MEKDAVGSSSHRAASDTNRTAALKSAAHSRGYIAVRVPMLLGQRFPAKLEILMPSNVTSVGQESA